LLALERFAADFKLGNQIMGLATCDVGAEMFAEKGKMVKFHLFICRSAGIALHSRRTPVHKVRCRSSNIIDYLFLVIGPDKGRAVLVSNVIDK